MLLVPWLIGMLLAHRAGVLSAPRVLLGPAWLLGYLSFNAASLWAKSPTSRRARHVSPMATYALLALVIGAAAVVLGGFGILWWAPIGAVLVGLTLWLVAHRRERSLLSGVVSVLAGAGVGVVTRWWSPLELEAAPATDLSVLALTMAYFVGTVPVVKTMIRERGSRVWVAGSTMYHLALFAAAGLCFGAGWIGVLWILWAVLCLLRAALEPCWVGRFTPMHVGLVEIGLSALLLLCALLG